MEIKEMKLADIEERMATISAELEKEDADIDALSKEVDELTARKSEIEAQTEKRETLIKEVIEERGTKTMETIKEVVEATDVRKSQNYVDAFASYIKTGDDTECRSLLTENVGGGVPVPEIVHNIIKHAWENDEIMNRVSKIYVKGNYKVGFEISATGAVAHEEGTPAPTEEELELGIVTMVPTSIKKWITISDEAMDMAPNDFLEYVYSEIAHKIAMAAAQGTVNKIINSPEGTSSATAPAVAATSVSALGLDTIVNAEALLSDEATDVVVLMNKSTRAALKGIQFAANYGVDPFDGLKVIETSALPSFADAASSDVFMIVGDLKQGILANFPNGNEITFKYDDLSLAEKDLIKIVGREYVAIDVVAPFAFTVVKKA